jgi:hypothetical protein
MASDTVTIGPYGRKYANYKDSSCRTALMMAAKCGSIENAKVHMIIAALICD